MCQNSTNEVNMIRRILTLTISALLLAALLVPAKSQAATLSSNAGAVTTASGKLNVRSQASSGASIVASLNKGSYITLISQTGSWWKVEYAKGQYGYCHADYITIVQGTPVTVATSSGALNVRSGAGTSYPKVASLSKGETVLLLTTSNGWSRVLYHGTKTGYVSSQYLSRSYPAVSVWVPDLKQNDSRWAATPIASSGKTMAQIGCATTAIAMMESSRRGTVIYPDAMSRELSYTASGNVYWPSDYKVVTDSSSYLSQVYDLLSKGKPVLLGMRNSWGSQHWVVVTGFQGGKQLTLDRFTIRDPGTYSRTSLQQFTDAYPAFYNFR